MTNAAGKIPAFVNAASGSADVARSALSDHGGFDVQDVAPKKLAEAIEAAMATGAPRVLVAGGDGTIATAARSLLDSSMELAILPGGTLNHFARDLGIDTDSAKALDTATSATARGVDVGMVNGELFLNTSSVGAYVHFVRTRESLERFLGYRLASAIAALRSLIQLRLITVEVQVDGAKRIYRTPLVFLGVGERETKAPAFGKRVPNGKHGLHVMIVRGRSRARVLAIALNAMARGLNTVAKTPELDSFIVDRCRITLKRRGRVAIDGELVKLGPALDYELRAEAVQIVCP